MIGYEIKTNDSGDDHVVLVSMGNHEPLLSSEVYQGDQSAEHLVELLKKAGLDLVHVSDDMTIGINGPDADEDMEDLDA